VVQAHLVRGVLVVAIVVGTSGDDIWHTADRREDDRFGGQGSLRDSSFTPTVSMSVRKHRIEGLRDWAHSPVVEVVLVCLVRE
jgi:hypothetical protein